ncbi:type II toxin-antitoxin system PemK/MazF family toxin [Rugosimonospora africana]|uniref:type II toxin-antitoxin system PemK/MazF family toxin n=1 Tax=Rugosimonospora africana TaxID=556532 RepID=UPI0023B29C54|nr:type II toxin-antitoxin system PemK/MazF family toxin [Rugosimonospora africana]
MTGAARRGDAGGGPRSAEVRPISGRRSPHPRRGQVYWLDVPGVGRRPWLIVSADEINRTAELDHVVAVRVSTADRRRHLPTVVALGPGEPLSGSVLAGTVMQVRRDRFVELAGTLSPDVMSSVDIALRETLGLR